MIQFNTKVNILRITSTSTAMGLTEVLNVLHCNLPCRIIWKTGSQKILFEKDSYFRDGTLYCRVIDVTTRDRVQYGSKTYEVVDVNNYSQANKLLAVTLKLVE